MIADVEFSQKLRWPAWAQEFNRVLSLGYSASHSAFLADRYDPDALAYVQEGHPEALAQADRAKLGNDAATLPVATKALQALGADPANRSPMDAYYARRRIEVQQQREIMSRIGSMTVGYFGPGSALSPTIPYSPATSPLVADPNRNATTFGK